MSTNELKLNINDKDRKYAKIYASLIEDEYQRKRANAAISALYAYVDFLRTLPEDLSIQNSMTLYRNPEICEKFEIADFYINNYHIDVRVTSNSSFVFLPKIHYENDIKPDFYVVIKVDNSLLTAEFAGIIDVENVQIEPFDYHYYKINSNSFLSHDEFLNRIKNKKIQKFDVKEHDLFKNNYLSFIDNEISSSKKIEILKHLFKCDDCKTEFCCFTGFEMVSCNSSNYPNILTDETLNIIGAQAAYDEKYEGKEKLIFIGNDKFDEFSDLKNPPEENNSSEQEILEKNKTLEDLFDNSKIDNNYSSNLTVDENKETEENSSVQKVIIDYNDEGEPLYSYITGAENSTEQSEIQTIDEELPLIPENFEDSNYEFDLELEDLVEKTDEDFNNEQETIQESDIDELVEETEHSTQILDETSILDEMFEPEKSPDINYDFIEENEESPQNTLDKQSAEEEIDILDQMFIDGELEQEKEEFLDKADTQENTELVSTSGSEIEIPVKIAADNHLEKDDAEHAAVLNPVNEIEIEEEHLGEELEENVEDEHFEKEDNILDEIKNETSLIEDVETKSDDDIMVVEKTSNEEPPQVGEETSIESNLTEQVSQNETDELSSVLADSSENTKTLKTSDIEDDEEEEDYYEEGEDEDMSDENSKDSSLKYLLIIITVAAILLGACAGGIFFYLKNKNNSQIEQQKTQAIVPEIIQNDVPDIFDMPMGENSNIPENNLNTEQTQEVLGEYDLLENQSPKENESITPPVENNLNKQENNDINKTITKALSASENIVTLKGINWFCESALYADEAFKNYMQNLDNTLKQNLKNNIFEITEIPPVNEVSAKFAVDNDRNLRKVVITNSSGLKQVDDIVLRSINETFEGEKSPILIDSPLKSEMYYFKVVIKL